MKCWVKPMFGVQSITEAQGDPPSFGKDKEILFCPRRTWDVLSGTPHSTVPGNLCDGPQQTGNSV